MDTATVATDRIGNFLDSLVHSAETPFAIRLERGAYHRSRATPRFVLHFPKAETLHRLLRRGALADFADAYVNGEIKVRGDIEAAVGLVGRLRQILPPPTPAGSAEAERAEPRTVDQDAGWVRAHYDLPVEFFRLFLDPELVYSCAYFENADDDLEHAQRRKLELICRKLQLQRGDAFLDVGCGWGALLFHARGFGARTHGITLSELQAATVAGRARKTQTRGVTAEVCHYEALPTESWDKVASIGMIEHVGRVNFPAYFRTLYRTLKPGGLLLNQGITIPRVRLGQTGGEFISKHVFPGSELAPIGDWLAGFEDAGFEVLDVQSLRLHYAQTLRHWSQRYFARRTEAARLVPPQVLRAWDIYLPACAEAFESGVVGVHQVVVHKPDLSGRHPPPFTRESMLGAPATLLDVPSSRA